MAKFILATAHEDYENVSPDDNYYGAWTIYEEERTFDSFVDATNYLKTLYNEMYEDDHYDDDTYWPDVDEEVSSNLFISDKDSALLKAGFTTYKITASGETEEKRYAIFSSEDDLDLYNSYFHGTPDFPDNMYYLSEKNAFLNELEFTAYEYKKSNEER